MSGPTTAIGPAPAGVDHGEYSLEGRKAKRELSQSKRAAQNRAAQVSTSHFHCSKSLGRTVFRLAATVRIARPICGIAFLIVAKSQSYAEVPILAIDRRKSCASRIVV